MIIAVPKEIKEQESRVSVTPAAVHRFTMRGHEVLVEQSAGVAAGFSDAAYEAAGARILPDHAALFERGELVVKVKEPLPSEYALAPEGADPLHLSAPGGEPSADGGAAEFAA